MTDRPAVDHKPDRNERSDPARTAIDRLVDDLGDIETVRIVVEMYLTELSSRAEALLDARPAAIEDARRAAHTLRSTSALVGADQLARLCQDFEEMDEPDGQMRQRLTEEIDAVESFFKKLGCWAL